MSKRGWIGVDLDGTLAEYNGFKGPLHIGAPIPKMVERVKKWLADGQEVRIFTARVAHDGSALRMLEAFDVRSAIYRWCIKHIGRALPVTNVKDYAMVELWDDRAVQVETNTGAAPVDVLTNALISHMRGTEVYFARQRVLTGLLKEVYNRATLPQELLNRIASAVYD